MPELIEGFDIQTFDFGGKLIDYSNKFNLDATAFTVNELPDDSVEYTIPDGKVQTLASYTIKITSSVPFETKATANGGCYVKYTFPKEL